MAGLRGRALVAYLLVCIVWGSTYLAIRIGVQELPPLLFAGVRFLIAGAAPGRPRPAHRRAAARAAARLGRARGRRSLPPAGRQRGGGLGRAVRRVRPGERLRGRGPAVGRVLRRDDPGRLDRVHLAGRRGARARLLRERAPRRRVAHRPARRRSQGAGRSHPCERELGPGLGLQQATPDRELALRGLGGPDAGGRRGDHHAGPARGRGRRLAHHQPRPGRPGVPGGVRLDRGLHRLRLRAASTPRPRWSGRTPT